MPCNSRSTNCCGPIQGGNAVPVTVVINADDLPLEVQASIDPSQFPLQVIAEIDPSALPIQVEIDPAALPLTVEIDPAALPILVTIDPASLPINMEIDNPVGAPVVVCNPVPPDIPTEVMYVQDVTKPNPMTVYPPYFNQVGVMDVTDFNWANAVGGQKTITLGAVTLDAEIAAAIADSGFTYLWMQLTPAAAAAPYTFSVYGNVTSAAGEVTFDAFYPAEDVPTVATNITGSLAIFAAGTDMSDPQCANPVYDLSSRMDATGSGPSGIPTVPEPVLTDFVASGPTWVTIAAGGDVTIDFLGDAPGAGAGAGPHAAATSWGSGLSRVATEGWLYAHPENPADAVYRWNPVTQPGLTGQLFMPGEQVELEQVLTLYELNIANPSAYPLRFRWEFA